MNHVKILDMHTRSQVLQTGPVEEEWMDCLLAAFTCLALRLLALRLLCYNAGGPHVFSHC